MNKNAFYITTTAPYVNSAPHIGFALEIIQADVLARFKRMQGCEVFFNFGTDEHGQKIYQKALSENRDPKDYVDEYAKKFNDLKKVLNLSYDNLTRTTDSYHIKAAHEMWKRCLKNGFIEKGIYNAKYCIGCELEKQDSDLENGRCPYHPNLDIETIEEENYFFKFSKFQKDLLELYKKQDFILPNHRLKEITNFVKDELKDFSISRIKDKMPWGIPVPNDKEHVMYVWFDALTFYISALGWPNDTKSFEKFWGTTQKPNAIQLAGKDNLRQQASMWQAMLLAAGLPASKQILIHGFISSGGQKMSKSLGNVVDPIEYVKKYGTDSLRYYLLAKISPFEDSDFTKKSFEHVYQADLANGLGNTVSRIAKLCEMSNFSFKNTNAVMDADLEKLISNYKFDKAVSYIWEQLSLLDINITHDEPWTVHGSKLNKLLEHYVKTMRNVAYNLSPFLPHTSKQILKQFKGPKIKSNKPLFPRLK